MGLATKTALIVDDDEFFRIALRTVVTGTLGFSEVLEAENFDQATALLSGNKIDLAVFDLMMPGMAGPGSLKGVRERFPDLCLVMATVSNRRQDILLALQAGVNGYIAKSMGLKELSSALAQILGGKVYVPASIASSGITGSADEIAATAAPGMAPTLTPRQKDVLTLIVKGNSNKEIARGLGLGEGSKFIWPRCFEPSASAAAPRLPPKAQLLLRRMPKFHIKAPQNLAAAERRKGMRQRDIPNAAYA